MMTPAMRADLAGREQDIQRGKTVELLRRAGKEMYDNPIVNTAIGFTPVLGDVQAAGETMSALERGAPWQETAGYAAGMLPFVPMIGKTVWHGSPHTFDKFDLSKIGTGEGAQAYGHGLYLAEAPETAKSYSGKLSSELSYNGKPMNRESSKNTKDSAAWALYLAEGDKEAAKASGLAKPELIDKLDYSKLQPGGQLYKVDLPDEQIAKMLDYDLPLANQPEQVKQSLLQLNDPHINEALSTSPVYNEAGDYWSYMGNTYGSKNEALQDVTPMQLISGQRGSFKSPQEASQRFYEAGIPGIQYLDQASRGAGEGTRNYVVFSDEIPQILERNGQPVAQALRNYEAPKQSTLQDVVSPIEQRGVTLDVYESNKKPLMTLSRIEVPKEMRGQGVGTQAMQDLVNYANQQGKTIALSPSTDFGGTSVGRLKDFYKQFGFVENKGRNKDFEISESMYRLPETE